MKKRTLSKLLATVTAFALLTGCSSTATTTTTTTDTASTGASDELYGMVVFLQGSEFFNWCYAGFRDAAATVGAQTEYLGPADWDAAAEAKAVDELVAKGANGIAVTAGDAATLVPSINAAIAAGVPTLTFDSDSPDSDRMLFVGTDSYNSGYQAGYALGEKMGDSARVAISMMPGLDSIIHRIEGFEAGLAEAAPGAEVVIQVNDEGDVNKAEEVLTAALQADPSINAIFCAHGNPGVGAVKAASNVGRSSGDNAVNVCAYSLDVAILEMVENDELFGTVAQNPYLMGVEAFFQLYSAAHPTQFDNANYPGMGNVPTASIDTGVALLTKGDAMIQALMTAPDIG